MNYYQYFSNLTQNFDCKIPVLINAYKSNEQEKQQWYFILQDLDALGYEQRLGLLEPNDPGIEAVIKWLANFHICYLKKSPKDLWQIGTYWHLNTRLEELKKIKNREIVEYAPKIDQKLNSAQFQTFVHGDAKIANFCFDKTHSKVAAVDFQYVGGGIGLKDLTYFLGSSLEEDDCEEHHQYYLETYFKHLENVFVQHDIQKKFGIDFQELKEEWTNLYPYCWADFYRFLKGWNPNHWKANNFHKQFFLKVVDELNNKK